ncbi:DUF6483 family protein [Paenibacillus guangzhouensis]|uniref:DUF6483 family protein n=1 Tax=Paenibacillus guangzhouensis TaxID=1473112 RepID=UPI00126713C1|nr:DUF6483 family protein [Paenibacillus guangzhouensis]
MFQRDYLVRLIEEMTNVLGKAMGLRQDNKLIEAESEIDELLQRKFRLRGPLLQSLSAEDLIKMFTFNGVLESDRLQGVALLMKQQAMIEESRQDPGKAVQLRTKALHLLAYASTQGYPVKWVKTSEEIRGLEAELQGVYLSDTLHRLLWEHYASNGSYAKAEDHLFHLYHRDPEILLEGIAFYNRLLEQTDEDLEEGGLPREEVLQGLAQLQGEGRLK